MKKLLVIIISLLYLTGIAEVSFSFHYCGKKMKYVTLFEAKEKPSCCAKLANDHGHNCCDDKEVKLNIGDQHHAKAKVFIKQLAFDAIIPTVYKQYTAYLTDVPQEVTTRANAPPLINKVRLHVLHCSYLI